jgi:hypothetical protein
MIGQVLFCLILAQSNSPPISEETLDTNEQTPPKKRTRLRPNVGPYTIPNEPIYGSSILTGVQVAKSFDSEHVYELARRVTVGQDFDKVCNSADEFEVLEQETWYGRLYCDLSSCLPFSTNPENEYFNGIERLLQIIFTRYANKEYTEGIFIIRAEFGADWFTPILQHPICILRHVNSRAKVSASFESYVAFYMGPNVNEFCINFRNVGLIPGFNCW